ncbi:MAG: hypothetical protein ACOX7U_04980 [Desulfitobacteriia bacterium]|jgi:hypothetical protein
MTGYTVLINGDQVPLQPVIKLRNDYYFEKVKEWNKINQNAAVFYQFKVNKNSSGVIRIIPDGCVEILFCCHPTNPTATFYGKRTKNAFLHLKPGYEYFGFRPFSPGA